MAFDSTNTFTLNKNDKAGNEARPDYRGKINITGREFWISAWIKDGPKGKFMSGVIGEPVQDKYASKDEPKQQAPRQSAQSQAAPASFDNFDDDIPF
jgi:hypothetical protein